MANDKELLEEARSRFRLAYDAEASMRQRWREAEGGDESGCGLGFHGGERYGIFARRVANHAHAAPRDSCAAAKIHTNVPARRSDGSRSPSAA